MIGLVFIEVTIVTKCQPSACLTCWCVTGHTPSTEYSKGIHNFTASIIIKLTK